MRNLVTGVVLIGTVFLAAPAGRCTTADELASIDKRFAQGTTSEVPDFQQHVVPLFGRLGCNGRACHGSFQGRGGFRLSLFGYDFAADHQALTDQEGPRVDPAEPDESLIIVKPTDADEHEGGQRYEKGSWQHHVLLSWIQGGAKYDAKAHRKLDRLEVSPSEVVFRGGNESVALKAVAVWADGTREDVTPLCRFQTNDEEIAKIDTVGTVSAGQPGDTHVVVFYDIGVQPVPVLRPVSEQLGNRYPKVPVPTKIDRLVVDKLKKLGIVPSELCSDSEFLRRVSLDLTGTLPTPKEIQSFLKDKRPDKRARKIDELLATPAYAAWWTTRLCDYTGNNDAQLVNVVPARNGQASRDWYNWILKRVSENTPYDELAAGIITAQSRAPGESYLDYCREMSQLYGADGADGFAERETLPHYWARREFRSLESRAIGVAYTFMGVRIQCAQCHKHPFDQWTKEDFAQFQNFFAGVVTSNRPPGKDQAQYNQLIKQLGLKGKNGGQARREIQRMLKEGKTVPFPEVYVAKATARRGGAAGRSRGRLPSEAKLPGSEVIDLTQHDDPRAALMQWLRADDNPYFSRAFVNRVWANYFGVGIVDPPDDMSLGNPPSNKPLLDYLAQAFIENGYDMKWLHREITNSRTYQLSWEPNDTNTADRRNFSRAIPRRLPAEVVFDAVRQATASDAQLAKAYDSLEGRAVAVPGSSARGGRRSSQQYALTVFGRSTRESNCDCDRSSDPSLLQTVYLQNDRDIHAALIRKDGWLAELAKEFGQSVSANQPKRPANYEKLVRVQRERIRRLRKAGKTAMAAKALQQLNQALRRFGDPAKPSRASGKRPDVNIDSLVSEAYLRTLSRTPNPAERNTAEQYVRDAENIPAGMRDILWALVNTKEFIVNH
jgi:hypothetical protein